MNAILGNIDTIVPVLVLLTIGILALPTLLLLWAEIIGEMKTMRGIVLAYVAPPLLFMGFLAFIGLPGVALFLLKIGGVFLGVAVLYFGPGVLYMEWKERKEKKAKEA